MDRDVTKSFDADNAHHTIEKPVNTIPISPLKDEQAKDTTI